jgi:hypothetical protein
MQRREDVGVLLMQKRHVFAQANTGGNPEPRGDFLLSHLPWARMGKRDGLEYHTGTAHSKGQGD